MIRQIPDFRRAGLKIGVSENLHFIQRERESLDIAITVVRCPAWIFFMALVRDEFDPITRLNY